MIDLQRPHPDFSVRVSEIKDFSLQYYYQSQPTVYGAKTFAPHVHDEVEVYVLLDGDVSFMVEKTLYKLTSGDIILTKPNEIHNCVLNSKSIHKHICLWITCSSSFLLQPLIAHEFGKNNLITSSPEQKAEMLANLRRLIEASEQGNKLTEFACGIELIRYIADNAGKNSVTSPAPDVLRVILDEMNRDFSSITSIDEICNRHFVSHSTLCRLFKKHLHTTPRLYLESKRLAYSRILLRQGKSVMDACIESGFTDYSNYIRLFKSRFGITPNKYKE